MGAPNALGGGTIAESKPGGLHPQRGDPCQKISGAPSTRQDPSRLTLLPTMGCRHLIILVVVVVVVGLVESASEGGDL